MRRCWLAGGHVHGADGQKPCDFQGGDGRGTMGERVVWWEACELLPAKTTWGRVVQLSTFINGRSNGRELARDAQAHALLISPQSQLGPISTYYELT